MKLYYDKRAKDPIYYIQQGFRVGKKTSTKNIERIGKHSELLLITDDPFQYAKNRVAEVNKQLSDGKADISFTVNFNEKLDQTDSLVSSSTLKNIGYLFLQKIYHDMEISSFFNSLDHKATFDCNDINRFLTFSRILDPMSKLGTFDHLNVYIEDPQFEYQHILRFMDILVEHYNEYISYLFNSSKKVINRDTNIMYFDCTNYYFEIETEDEDYIDEVTGELIKGLRKFGICKEHRPNPIVQMGLFIDQKGIPVSMCIHHGSNNEQNTAVPLERIMVKEMGINDFIYCADAGLGSTAIKKFNDMKGRKFIVTQSIKKLSDVLQKSVFEDIDYRLLSSNKIISLNDMKTFDKFNEDNKSLYEDKAYKVIEVTTDIDIGLTEEKTYLNGKKKNIKSKAQLKQRIIITFSRKMMEYQRAVRNRQIERAKKLMETRDIDEIKKGPSDVRRFIKTVKSEDTKYVLDSKKIEEEEKYDGFYAVATNLDDNVKDILAVNSQRYKIEDCFRVMKTNFDARPIYHRNPERIKAHFMICFTALLIARILENKLDETGKNYTIADVIETLKNMNVSNVEEMYYQACFTGGKINTALNKVFELSLDKKYYKMSDMNKLKKLLKK